MGPSFSIKTFLVLSLVIYSIGTFADDQAGSASGPDFSAAFSNLMDRATCSKPTDAVNSNSENISSIETQISTLEGRTYQKGCSVEGMVAFKNAYKIYSANLDKCAASHMTAKTNCLEKCSPAIHNLSATANMILTGMRSMSIVDACGKMGDVMNVVQTGLTAFSANCGARKVLCDRSCQLVLTAVKDMRQSSQAMVPYCGGTADPVTVVKQRDAEAAARQFKSQIQSILSNEELGSDKAVATKVKECAEYAMHIGSAGAGILQALNSAKQSANCEEKTDAFSGVAGLDCTKPENENNAKCICERSPRTPGCSGTNTVGNDPGFTSPKTTLTDRGGSTANLNASKPGAGLDLKADGSEVAKDAGGNMGGAPLGGGGGGGNLDSGGGFSNADSSKQQGVIRRLSTNMYGGEGGGGGSGGRGGMPGAPGTGKESLAKDPKFLAAREIASIKAQVTSPAGKSNWEKIKERYSTNKPTLLAP